ncbi:DUF5825 family protein [Nocardia jinanensis]|uniref:Uncharacterized protein n=1 Tax=Nocardia jinanensis TaxID=382504 RepID=A0A917RX73_9NOCA|nr:DUF5825 family protein [Nocardia jinanensis]GGL39784.1 hypothetical protein GCM10011588_63210 [Nocardia jinanensis]
MTDPLERWPETVPADLTQPAHTVAAARRLGQIVTVVDPVRFSGGADDFAVLRLLGAAMQAGVRIDWTLVSAAPNGLDDIVHLPPPAHAMGSIGKATQARWRERHQAGLCCYRHGPDFVAIKDNRRPRASFRATLDEPHATLFRTLAAASRVAELTSDELRLLTELRDNGLAFIDGVHFLLSPYRVRTFPIPCTTC